MNPKKDSKLVKEALGGSAESFGCLVERYFGTVYMVAYSRLGHREAAEDLAQEVFLRVYQNLDQIREPRLFCAWVSRITRNLATNWYKRKQRYSELIPMISAEDLDIPDSAAKGAREQLQEKERDQSVQSAIMELPCTLREVVLLHYTEGLDKKEIARRLGVHPSSVGRQIEKALGMLKDALEPVLYDSTASLRPSRSSALRAVGLVMAVGAMTSAQKAAFASAAASIVASSTMTKSGLGGLLGSIKGLLTTLAIGGAVVGAKKAAVIGAVVLAGVFGGLLLRSGKMLHVFCNEYCAENLKERGVRGEVIVWSDPLAEGPTPEGLTSEEFRKVRAKYLADSSRGVYSLDGCLRKLTDEDAALARYAEHDEVVLWFDACLFDQTILIRQLDYFARQDMGKIKLSLICIGEFPGLGKLHGLGELTGDQLASLLGERHEVTAAELQTAQKAWAAFCSPDPTDIETLLEESDLAALPYLEDALIRHLQKIPSVKNGLSRLENEALAAIDSGVNKLGPIFGEVNDMERPAFFSDTTLWAILQEMADCGLLRVDGPGPLPTDNRTEPLSSWTVHITETGKEVLDGNEDRIDLCGIDRWLGGVHLTGEHGWRRDEKNRRLLEY